MIQINFTYLIKCLLTYSTCCWRIKDHFLVQLPVGYVHFLHDKIPFKLQNVQGMLDEQNVEGPDVVFAIKKKIMLVFNMVENYMTEMCSSAFGLSLVYALLYSNIMA